MKKSVLFIIPAQYGYHTDSYKYCELLSDKYNVVYLGIDAGKPLHGSHTVEVHSIDILKCRFWRLSLLALAFQLNRSYNFDKIFVYSFPLCSLFILLFSRKRIIMDIRTSFIEGKIKSKFLNVLLAIESNLFSRISVISWGVARFLHLNINKCKLLPLGGDKGNYYPKQKHPLLLLYVGTFYDRYIERTVYGLSLFVQKHRDIQIHYTIIGFGTNAEIQKILDAIKDCNLEKIVSFEGEKRHECLLPYFKSHNVGVSFIPLTAYYDCQPPTKTYEYLLNGMAVLATATSENAKVIDSSNGILIKGDAAKDFCEGIEQMSVALETIDLYTIYRNAQQYSWNNIVNNYLIPIIED